MFLRLAQIFTSQPIDGPAGYKRGFTNACTFMAEEKPDAERLKRELLSCDPAMDDYDRGYYNGLRSLS